MAKKKVTPKSKLRVEAIVHEDAKRRNIPTAEYQSLMQKADKTPIQVAYERRNKDLDPQLIWRGKDVQDWSDLVVAAPPLYIQEKVHPKVLIEDLLKRSDKPKPTEEQINLFADFNGLPTEGAKTEFYQHDSHWSNRMILGDSLQVMASLAEREGLRGKVQCIYFDPPYGIKFNSNFQWSTTSRDVKDGKTDHITREPEQVKAFRDTWRDGIHSYLTYLRDRLTVARDLLSDTGSIFVQIGDENVHRVRAVLDEVFGDSNFVANCTVRKTTSDSTELLGSTCDFVLWFAKKREMAKARTIWAVRGEDAEERYSGDYGDGRRFQLGGITSSRPPGEGDLRTFKWFGKDFEAGNATFKTTEIGLTRAAKADRLAVTSGSKLRYRRFHNDFGFTPIANLWTDISGAVQSRSDPKVYVVQSSTSIVERCILMASDPGDLVLDPTCGSGTTATVAEQWGRRWITIDTSRVALALARTRIMGAKYPFYILADSREGQQKEAEISRSQPSTKTVHGSIRQGFVYERVPHITLKSIANNSEIDVIWDKWQKLLEPLRTSFNSLVNKKYQEWDMPKEAEDTWSGQAKKAHSEWWQARLSRQKEIDASIDSKADFEFLFDKPYIDKKTIRVAGPFTVESISPHKVLSVDANDNLVGNFEKLPKEMAGTGDFVSVILENLRTAGVQQAHKEDKISFTSLIPWPGLMICAEASYTEKGSGKEKRAAIFVGPEFGTVSRSDLVEAAKEAAEADFDVLIACAFNYDARASEFNSLGRIPILKARMNADLHMAEDLKNTGKGNLFVIFGEPDIEIEKSKKNEIKVKINGVDVFHPNTGEVKSDGADGIACWFIDTDYDEESFFVRHAYFLGFSDPYKSLRASLKAEIDEQAWKSLYSDTSRPFEKPKSGRIAVKVINHLGDEVMKVFKVN